MLLRFGVLMEIKTQALGVSKAYRLLH